jgi:Protein of unknown function (DUF2800)
MPSRHSSVVGGSSAARILNCPGSQRLIATLPATIETPSPYATEGTALHGLMADLILGKLSLADLKPGTTEIVVEGEGTVTLTQELISDCLLPALAHWERLRAESDRPPLVELEAAFPGIPGAFGTCDLLVRSDRLNLTCLSDWKFGAGVAVAASYTDEDDPDFERLNEQLLFYAAAARFTHPEFFPPGVRIILTIVQPRAPDPALAETAIEVSLAELDAFVASLKQAVALSANPEAPLKLGTWCRFADCRVVCPLQLEPLFDLSLIAEGSASPHDESHRRMLVEILAVAPRVEELIAEARRQAQELMIAGDTLPGWKLVAKLGHRVWAMDPETLRRALNKAYGLKKAQLYEPKRLKTPAQVEKAMKAAGIKDKLSDRFATAPVTGSTLARETDKRPGLEGRDAPLPAALLTDGD